MEALGPIPERPAVGHGARGLQRQRRRLELFLPRPGPLACLRWGEDGIAGFSDDQQLLCLALALWNGNDPILKERLFGLTNSEGNHGEDVKEYYFYLDATPTHSYQRFLYKYPQTAYPYDDLVQTNQDRNRHELEYELLDTGVFDDDRYFDVTVEYAKAAVDDIVMRVTVANRGPDSAEVDVLPTVWFRNTWSDDGNGDIGTRPSLRREGAGAVRASHPIIGAWRVETAPEAELLFTENDTNTERLWGTPNSSRYVKDGINDYLVGGQHDRVNPEQQGTKLAARHHLVIAPGTEEHVYLRLRAEPAPKAATDSPDTIIAERRAEADDFYTSITPPGLDADRAEVMRQALADVNPPVHAWATLFAYSGGLPEHHGKVDVDFLRDAFKKLLLNFNWWVNRKDREGHNVFEGGFLGLDNIGIFDRSAPLPTGGYLEQADGTAWMALFSQNMLELALELATQDPTYEDFALRFAEHFFWIAAAMDSLGEHPDELWDEEDGFFYDVLRHPDGNAPPLLQGAAADTQSLAMRGRPVPPEQSKPDH
jgi:hypothetical protein